MNPALLDAVLSRSSEASKGSRIHGPIHWAGVAAAGYTLCEMTPEADPLTVLLFALFHDSMRQSDGHDPEHGQRGAQLAREMRAAGEFELDGARMNTLEEACTYHDKGQTSTDPTIGVCWDADRLNLPRVRIEPKAALLSTAAGRSLVGSQTALYFYTLRFDWAALLLAFDAKTSPHGERVYLRFGDLPEGGASRFSNIHDAEDGVSVYPGRLTSDESYVIDTRQMLAGSDTHMLRLMLSQARPLYRVDGSPAGIGASGEPVLSDARIVCEVTNGVKVYPQHREIDECLAWWKAARSGGRPGEFPHDWKKHLPGDRSPWKGWELPDCMKPDFRRFGEMIEEKKREHLKEWGLLAFYDKIQTAGGANRKSAPQPTPAPQPPNQSFNSEPWKESPWKESLWK